MTALAFGQLPPGLKSWKELYEDVPAEAPARWKRVHGSLVVTFHLDETIELQDDDTEDDIIQAALEEAGIAYECLSDYHMDVDWFGIDIEDAEAPRE